MEAGRVACGPLLLAKPSRPEFPDADPKWERTWDSALETLAQNLRTVPQYKSLVLTEGAGYPGIWLEGTPMEGLIYARLKQYVPDGHSPPAQIARANHMAFFALQREDGQLPAYIYATKNEVGFDTIQMVVPIAATAWGARTKYRRSGVFGSFLRSLQQMGCMAQAISRYAEDWPGGRILHMGYRDGSQPSVEGDAGPLSGWRCAKMCAVAFAAQTVS